jgi:hypothetical protein
MLSLLLISAATNGIYLEKAFNFRKVEPYVASTTLRLWHLLYDYDVKEKHEFASMIRPQKDRVFFAAILHDEIRSIAICSNMDDNTWQIDNIAHRPEQPECASILLNHLHVSNCKINWKALKNQPRWFCEQLFIECVET